MGLLSWPDKKTTPLLAHIGSSDHDEGWGGSQKWSNLDLGWVKVMCDEFGEVSGIIDLVINFLAAGTLFLNSYDTLSYTCSSLFGRAICTFSFSTVC